jgi:ferric-dicitrate binding protein FerR (iron transport regulator)
MSDRDQPLPGDTNEDDMARVLNLAGMRANVSADRARRVRSAVHAAWQARTRRRAIRRPAVLAAALTGTAALALTLGSLFPQREVAPLGDPVAVVDQVDGRSRLKRSDSVRIGEWIETSAESRIALRFSQGISVRLDTGSRLRAMSANVVELAAGGVYVDTEEERGGFEVRTGVATARDIGTQFEVRLVDESLRLRVRSGMVQLTDRKRSMSGRPGTEITLSATGVVSRPIVAHGPEWDWTTRVSPPLEMEGMSLASFLERLVREHGWTLDYGDVTVARDAEGITLHGSVSELGPHEAVDVAVTTSGLRHQFDRGLLVVHRADAPAAEARDDTR